MRYFFVNLWIINNLVSDLRTLKPNNNLKR